jgi:hypothetical protein
MLIHDRHPNLMSSPFSHENYKDTHRNKPENYFLGGYSISRVSC